LIRCDDLPPARRFVSMDGSGWSSHPDAPGWLLKKSDQVYCHGPTSTLWSRHHLARRMVRVDGKFGLSALHLAAFSTPPVLLRALMAGWREAAFVIRKWRRLQCDDLGDEAPRPCMRTAAKGRQHRPKRGVSPPPFEDARGWTQHDHGWQLHKRAPKWLRKQHTDGDMYFYLPTESLWKVLPSGLFVCMDGQNRALLAMSSSSALLRTCLHDWRCMASVTKQWRLTMSMMTSSGISNTDACDPYAAADEVRFSTADALLACCSTDDEDESPARLQSLQVKVVATG